MWISTPSTLFLTRSPTSFTFSPAFFNPDLVESHTSEAEESKRLPDESTVTFTEAWSLQDQIIPATTINNHLFFMCTHWFTGLIPFSGKSNPYSKNIFLTGWQGYYF
jgi:hypothetical protein